MKLGEGGNDSTGDGRAAVEDGVVQDAGGEAGRAVGTWEESLAAPTE